MTESNRVTAYLKVTAEFYDPEATPETVRACVEQDLTDAGYEVDVSSFGNWIPVKDRLPKPKSSDEYTDYIVHIVDDEGNWAIGIAEYDVVLGVGVWRIGPDSVTLPDGMCITHWMETPEPPEAN